MNFVDPFDIATASSSTPPPRPDNEQSLNEEVNQVIGQLGRFWGGFRQQSQAALQVAKKDLGDVVQQAQKELTKLTTEVTSPAAPETPAGDPSEGEASAHDSADRTPVGSPTTEQASAAGPSTSTPAATATAQVSNIFNRLQAALPPAVVSAVQHNLETVQHTVQHNIENLQHTDLNALRQSLSAEFARVQGVTRAQAEEYMHRSEELLREAGDVLKDAVKVLPPEDDGVGMQAGVVWDGSDIWMLPEPTTGAGKGKGRASAETQRSVSTRAEALLRRLRSDPEIILHDPEADEKVKGIYDEWLKNAEFSLGGEKKTTWDEKIPLYQLASSRIIDLTPVPDKLSEEVFWKRYFFRVHQIETEEAKRKTLLQAQVNDNEEDFSWGEEDEEEEDITSTHTIEKPLVSEPAVQKLAEPKPEPASAIPAHLSSRESSGEESYDVVSSNVSAVGEEPKKEKEKDESEEDSDWE
uniref:BSD domain-containing protein n=1 Tax=Schizophyllum commune (strain H4-8 / FGSC 9210) TaxID=578458 RepID=D8QCF5_SCHCM